MNFDENRDITVISIKIEIFRKFLLKSRFLCIYTDIEILTKIGQNGDFSNILTEIEISENFDENRDVYKL